MTIPSKCECATQTEIREIDAKTGFAAASDIHTVQYGATPSSAMEAHATAMAHNHGVVTRCVARM